MTTNSRIALLIAMMVNAVLFGIGAITVLSVPSLAIHAKYLLAGVVAASFAMTPFISAAIAPKLRSARWKARNEIDR